MTLFIVLATLLVLIAVLVLGVSIWRQDPVPDLVPGLEENNIAIARERLAALDALHPEGSRSSAEYAEERARIESLLASELGADKHGSKHSRIADITLIALLVISVPASAVWLYSKIGTPGAVVTRTPIATTDEAAPSLPELVAGLEQRLAETPDDVTGWRMLGRTRLAMNEFDQAIIALQKALTLGGDDTSTLTNLAQAHAQAVGGDLTGAATPLLERALELDPTNNQTLWLLGIARQQAGEHEQALDLLGRLRAIALERGDSQAVAAVDNYAAISQTELGIANGPIELPNVSDGGPDNANAAPGNASVTVRVSLAEAAAKALSPDTAVFVFARAATGPAAPLAVQRLTVADLPTTVILDESMAMIPTMTLGSVSDVVVGARASISGQPIAAPGDWSVESALAIGEAGTVDAPLALEISEQIR